MSAENNPVSFEIICRHRQLLQPGNASVSTIAHQGHSLCQVRVGSKGKLEQLEYSIVRGALVCIWAAHTSPRTRSLSTEASKLSRDGPI